MKTIRNLILPAVAAGILGLASATASAVTVLNLVELDTTSVEELVKRLERQKKYMPGCEIKREEKEGEPLVIRAGRECFRFPQHEWTRFISYDGKFVSGVEVMYLNMRPKDNPDELWNKYLDIFRDEYGACREEKAVAGISRRCTWEGKDWFGGIRDAMIDIFGHVEFCTDTWCERPKPLPQVLPTRDAKQRP